MIKLIFVFGVFCFFSCGDKEKTNQEKVIGTWKREVRDGITGKISIPDTFTFTSNSLIVKNKNYSYQIDDKNFFYFSGSDTISYCYKFISETNIELGCFISPGGLFMNLKKI